jgi:hypothetical protein
VPGACTLAPKAKRFSLGEKLKLALPRERFPDFSRFAAYDVGIDAAKFAYFALNGTYTTRLDLGPHREIIRKFLAGETGFPYEVFPVIVIVCSDPEARSLWIIPCHDEEVGCENFRFIARGVFFRVLVGRSIPPSFQGASCVSPRQPIAYGDLSRRLKEDLPGLLKAPVQ